jgi:molybdate transport system substrate-binding protein
LGKLTSIVFGLLIATGFGANAAEIKVLTARAGATVLEKIGPEFERATGIKLNVISGFGPAFVKRINDGEPFDVFIAGPPLIDGLIKNGKILADSRINLLRSGMGVELRA